jgi:hypothetical protein
MKSIGNTDNDRHVSRRRQGFAIKLFIGGTAATLVGLWWLVDGIGNGPVNQLHGGMRWKGPLLFLAGVAADIMGFRMLRELHGTENSQESWQPGAGRTGFEAPSRLDLPQLVGLNCAFCQRTVASVSTFPK